MTVTITPYSLPPITLFLLVGIGLSCGPRLDPIFEPTPECLDHPDSVPIVVVAMVGAGSKAIIGKQLTVRSIPAGPIQLLSIDVNVENVLKGDVPLGKSRVFYYSAAYPHGPNAIGFSFRDVLFLRRERGRLRMAADIIAGCSITVNSGAHPAFKPDLKQPLRQTLIDLLLTRGSGATDMGMIRAIFDSTANTISPRYTAKRLLRLSSSETPAVRVAACLEFRDLMVRVLPLGREFGIDSFELAKWHSQYLQNGWARDWWAHGVRDGELPRTILPPDTTMSGLGLCRNDAALGVPPLRPTMRAHRP